MLKEKKDHVNSFEKRYTNHIIINQKVGSNFTYNDLELLLVDIYSKQTNSFKINLGIAFVLYNIKTKEYKYHYVSSNQLLFEKAISITNMQDVERFMKKVCDLDLATNAYLRKPTSSWTLAGITNIEVWVYEMKNTPIGQPPKDLPSYIKDSKFSRNNWRTKRDSVLGVYISLKIERIFEVSGEIFRRCALPTRR